MKNEKTIKDFEKLYAGKIIRLNEDFMPVVRNIAGAGEERILRFPDCRSALAIMIREYGALYLPELEQRSIPNSERRKDEYNELGITYCDNDLRRMRKKDVPRTGLEDRRKP